MERARRNLHLVSNFEKLNIKQRGAVQKLLDNQQVKFIVEICYNILNNSLPLKETQKKILFNHREKIRKLGSNKVCFSKKKKIVTHGGFLATLLSVIASTECQRI